MRINRTICVARFIALSIILLGCGTFQSEEIEQLENAEIFSVSETKETIELDGVINSSAYDKFKALAEANPHIKAIEIITCEGSINDDVNLKLSKYIYDKGFNIHLKDNGLIASGGTDLFLSGRRRTKGHNTKIGVHSWAGDDQTATDFPKGHKYHQPYIDYYVSVGFTSDQAEDFYYFTINSAPAESIHWMTDDEISKYTILKN